MPQNIILIILDGFGKGENNVNSNAIFKANTPNLDKIFSINPLTFLEASGKSVGLPKHQMGNSEVGHTTIGSGRIIYQDLTRINNLISQKKFEQNQKINQAFKTIKKNNSSLHIMGLLSDGGIHSHTNHLYALLDAAKKADIKKIFVHAWLDGRDVSPKSSITYLDALENTLSKNKIGVIASISGRYYAMDRDKNWDRIQKAYNAAAKGIGPKFSCAKKAVEKSYSMGITDEFIIPSSLESYCGFEKGDVAICFNFRPDRVREITHLIENDVIENRIEKYYSFTEYEKNLIGVSTIFEPEKIKNTLSEYISECNYTQLKLAETEKYAHVTFFFNASVEKPYKGEDRIIVASPKIATYDLKPEMSAHKLTKKCIENIKKEKYNLIVINYANPDMVGHTGKMDATVTAIETIDVCVEKIIKEAKLHNYISIITADHGNSEKMRTENGTNYTCHTCNPVPFCIVGFNCKLKNSGKLSDIAPTILDIFRLKKPRQMTGKSLII